MKADERIEILLNRFGETIEDLPKSTRTDYACEFAHQNRAVLTAIDWDKKRNDNEAVLADYICHLTDIIDRMENALMTATMIANCDYCDEKRCNICGIESEGFRICEMAQHDEIEIDDEEE